MAIVWEECTDGGRIAVDDAYCADADGEERSRRIKALEQGAGVLLKREVALVRAEPEGG